MRKQIVAGNWKMNTNADEASHLASGVLSNSNSATQTEIILVPPFVHLSNVHSIINDSNVHLGAQNCHEKQSGAYTGEVSANMIKSLGASHVIIGHSERREYFNESDQLLAEKINAALSADLTPIFCCGERLESREEGTQEEVVGEQVASALFGLSTEEISKIVIAYEPVWAIGTGKTATADQAQEMHAFIRTSIANQYDQSTADEIPILYGGSVKPGNAKEIFSKPDVDGGLIGGASLNAQDFVAIINAFD